MIFAADGLYSRTRTQMQIQLLQGETFEHVRARAKATYQAMIDAALKD